MLSRVHFRPRAMPASMPYTKQNPFRLSPAGRTCAASAMTFIRRNRPLWPLKRLSPSRNCMASKSACVGNRPIFGATHGNAKRCLCWRSCTAGSCTRLRKSLRNRRSRARFALHGLDGRRSPAIAITARLKSTITRRNAHYAPWPWARSMIDSPVPPPAGPAPLHSLLTRTAEHPADRVEWTEPQKLDGDLCCLSEPSTVDDRAPPIQLHLDAVVVIVADVVVQSFPEFVDVAEFVRRIEL